MLTEINNHLNQFDFDVRKTHDARFVDQKCTPDIVCFIADCVINMVATKPIFVINDIWETQYFIHNSRVIFNKPWANDKNAYSEYNKVLSQPLKLLAYAKVLNVENISGVLTFSVNNEELLDYISRKDRNAYVFLYHFFVKVLTDSGFIKFMEDYKNGKISRDEVYNKYISLISGNTPSKSPIDIKRMFHKVFNVYAAEHGLVGSSGKRPRCYSDLMYNRVNWRDIKKDKTETRQEILKKKDREEKQQAINTYYVQKAISLIRKIHTTSEVHDQWGIGEATQVHHIFPKSTFPEIAHYVENLILLTATQHLSKAHPLNNTQIVDRDYQIVCLLAKADTIEKSLRLFGDRYYRKESFLYVLNTGLGANINMHLNFPQIKSEIVRIYNEQAS